MLFDQLVVVHDREPLSAAMNMAIDEALLEETAVPLLRFYRWQRPALSFGYFGRFEEMSREAGDRELVRRWTGGGAVLHGEDLTYSLVTPISNPVATAAPSRIYSLLHQAIRNALVEDGIAAELARTSAPKISEACFSNPVTHDVLLNGRKIAGAAQRRTRRGFLHQGSIQLPHLPESFSGRFAAGLAPKIQDKSFSRAVQARAATLVAEKYGREEWQRRW